MKCFFFYEILILIKTKKYINVCCFQVIKNQINRDNQFQRQRQKYNITKKNLNSFFNGTNNNFIIEKVVYGYNSNDEKVSINIFI